MGLSDTIFAVAAGGAGGSALTVMRISGAQSGAVLDAMCGRRPPPRHPSLRTLRNAGGEVLDRGLVLWFPHPGSYTGEDSGELHLHGGRAVMLAVARALTAAGARPAEPGEFTRRAFLNGRMDLTEAEAVGDLVAAETDAQRRQALRQLDGGLSALYRGWTERLVRIAAFYEALIDFADEDDGLDGESGVLRQVRALQDEIVAHLDDGRRGELVRQGLVFAIVGAPNVGKSSLLNALAASEIAIVSERPGTTRDVIEARLDLGGYVVTLLDTAGLRETEDAIEAEGIRRARARAQQADLVIDLRDVHRDRPEFEAPSGGAKIIVVVNKIDLVPPQPGRDMGSGGIGVSARTGEGIQRLRDILTTEARGLLAGGGDAPLTRVRHRDALEEAVGYLGAAVNSAGSARLGSVQAGLAELRAEDIRLALRALGRITGRVGAEDILDAVFAQFCIGK